MANNTIQIKRSATAASPVSLNPGELAYSNATGGTGVLYIGDTSGTQVVPIGGIRNPGTLTANQALVANSTSGINKVFAANLQVNFIEANGAGNTGTAGYVLFSGGSASNVYWAGAGGLGVNTAAQYSWTNTQSFGNTVTFNGQIVLGTNTISANGSNGTAGYALLSGGTGSNIYWSSIAGLGVNAAAQYTWSNTQTFQNTITFSTSILGNTINATSVNSGSFTVGSSTIANATGVYTGFVNATTVNASAFTVATSTIANASGVYTTVVNASSVNATSYGTVNATSLVIGTYGSSTNGIIANTSFFGWGNSIANVAITWDSSGQDILSIGGNQNNYFEAVIWNANGQSSASADFSINDNLGIYANNFIDIGINSSGFSNSQWTINGPSDAYVYTGNTNLALGTGGNQGNVTIFTAGTLAGNERMRITTSGNVGINNTNPLHKLSVNGTTYLGGDTTVVGNSTFGNVSVSGTLLVSGSLVSVNSVTLQVNDNVIELGFNNGTLTTDAIDSGFYTPSNTSGTLQYSGIARIAAASLNNLPWYKVFTTTTNPNSGLTITSSATGVLQAYLLPYGLGGAFVANSTVVNITANGTVSSALVANSLTLTTALAASYGGTGQTSYAVGDLLYASGTNALSKLSVAANGYVLQITNNLPAYGVLDAGTF
jgi:hypothetical protein